MRVRAADARPSACHRRNVAVRTIPNIGPRGQWQRLRFGIIALGAGAVLAAALFALHAPAVARAACFPLLWLAGLGYYQARDKT
ncbi:MAG TPA: hypothetical protein VKQ05_03555 [Gemmatimonadales bacterium]|nr:hypothetical protein [Gemmatimonadales bacterium]